MNDKKKGVLAVLVALAIVALLWLFLRKSGSPTADNGNYMTYNSPQGNAWTGTAGGLSSLPPAIASNSCGCNSNTANGNFFGSLQDMLNSFTSGAGNALNEYFNTVFSSLPSGAAQYENNPAGYQMAVSSQQALAGVSTDSSHPFTDYGTLGFIGKLFGAA